MDVKLTQYSKGAGCGCKLSPNDLHEILKGSYAENHPELIVGNRSHDDAAVMDTGGNEYLISTTDFFTPIVDDPFDFGKIAAANALSDVYAMGGTPTLAIAILGWPIGKIPHSTATLVIKGAIEMCKQAGIPLAGGHSIDSPEPFFGLSVNGKVEKSKLKRNSTPEVNDVLYITKPIGSGLLSTAQKRGKLSEELYSVLLNQLIHLNKEGELFGEFSYVHAMTDITGFGLLGHLLEMVRDSDKGVKLINNNVPLMEGVKEIIGQFIYPDNTMRNYQAVLPQVNGLNGSNMFSLCDPQTNGGLLLAVAQNHATDFENFCQKNSIPIFQIGTITENTGDKKIEIV